MMKKRNNGLIKMIVFAAIAVIVVSSVAVLAQGPAVFYDSVFPDDFMENVNPFSETWWTFDTVGTQGPCHDIQKCQWEVFR
jgi:hypothetical protein